MGNLGGYEVFSTTAKQFGGAEAYLSIIKNRAFQQGFNAGNSKQTIVALVALGAGSLITAGILKGPQLIQYCRAKFKREEITEYEAQAAEESLIREMQKVNFAAEEQQERGETAEGDVV